ncbi:MAG: NAD(P)/FAD-dependent oxidoreductase [Chloroflexi bacterium]|nr:NAD(P)/FAD-dependent oxidoreductase [Chloroflexota bacterium]
MAKKIAQAKYLIIGNSAGGIGAAEAIREVDKAGSISIVSDEPYPVYSRPLISEYLAEKCPLERMLFRPSDFYDKNNIQTVLGKQVKRLDLFEHKIELEDGSKICWEKLLLATGGSPIIPKIEGLEKRGVFTFITLDDAKAIDQYLTGKARAVVIGGGLIGVSATEALVKRGVEVAIIEMKERILNVMLDEEASATEEEALKRSGVNIITGHTVTKINGGLSEGIISSVTLDDGSQLLCNLVVLAIGVLPRTQLAAGAGIKINRGIVVDRHMKTSHPDVYACGDAAEAYDFIHGENRLTPVWPNAYLGGRVAGFNMAGIPTEYQGGTAMNSLKYFGLDVVSAGMVNPPDKSYEKVSRRTGNIYRKVILKDGFIVGMVFVGDIEKSGIVYNLMKDRINVEGFQQALVADDFGLVSLPEEMWRKRLEIPSSVQGASSTAVEELVEAAVGE